jgi:alpha/beta superfamily hydrolase
MRESSTFGCEVRFVGHASEQLFVSITYPLGPVVGVALVCPPVHADFARDYRVEVILSQTLAANGVVTARFHYRGMGHSQGDPEAMTLGSMTADAQTVLRLVRERFEATRLSLVGVRLGGYVAAAVAAGEPGAPVVLWEPVLTASSYFREAKRALRLANLVPGGDGESSLPSDVTLELEQRGRVDVHGYPVRKTLLDSFDRSLPAVLGDTPRAIKILQFGRSGRARSDVASAVAAWEEKGFQVDLDVLGGNVSWWSRGVREERDDRMRLAAVCVETTADWILRPPALVRAMEAS